MKSINTLDGEGLLSSLYNHAQKEPLKPAITFQGNELNYQDLISKVQVITLALKEQGVSQGDIVAVSCERSLLLIPLLLAVWNRGAAYVPIDPTFPADRKTYVLDNANAKVLVVSTHAAMVFDGPTLHLEEIADNHCSVKQEDTALTDPPLESLAYLIYTSGSTGKPKGVEVTQSNLINFLASMAIRPGISADDTLLAVTTISFDIHILELFLPLYCGASIVLASEEEARSASQLRALINDHEVSMMQATPATWQMILSERWTPKAAIKILVGGEALPSGLVPLLHQVASETWNMYGPTETTVWSTCFKLNKNNSEILIGTPIHNTIIHVVDEDLEPVSKGEPGELLIGGAGVTLGYRGLADLTHEKFISLPKLSPSRLYRTGDQVIETDDGSLKYINRLDNQIKIRGFRVEPGDIEACVENLNDIQQCCVVAARFANTDSRLVCFYTGQHIDKNILLKHCRDSLPAYMVPLEYLHLDEFPKTANLKIDRKRLVDFSYSALHNIDLNEDSDTRNDLDRSILGIWKTVLSKNDISIDDNFFDIGGHSLLALILIEELNRALGTQLSPEIIFTCPSIRQLSDHKDKNLTESTFIVPLNLNGEGTPIYCLCGVRLYSAFASGFIGKHPVYAVFGSEEIAMLDQNQKAMQSFDSTAFIDAYARAIETHIHGKRVILAGFSFGGILAAELAKKLNTQGYFVDGIILLDAYGPDSTYLSLTKVIKDTKNKILHGGIRALLDSTKKRFKKKISRANMDTNALLHKDNQDRERAFNRATKHFKITPQKLPMDVILIKANLTEYGFGLQAKADYHWRTKIDGAVRVFECETDHTGLLKHPTVDLFHQDILEYLGRPL